MAASAAFETACATLEQKSELDRLVARGTIRVVLKKAGLEPNAVTPHELTLAVKSLLPAELSSRGVTETGPLCEAVGQALAGVGNAAAGETPEAIFARLGGA